MTWSVRNHGGCVNCRLVEVVGARALVCCQRYQGAASLYVCSTCAKNDTGWKHVGDERGFGLITPGHAEFDPSLFNSLDGNDWALVVRYM